jgi:hypothetical protein
LPVSAAEREEPAKIAVIAQRLAKRGEIPIIFMVSRVRG